MRVAVHHPDGSVCAYRLGRVIDGQHTHNLATGEVTPLDDIMNGLVRQAQEEYPDSKVVIERLVQSSENSDEGVWVDASVNTEAPAVESQEIIAQDIETVQEIATAGEGV